MLRTFIVTTLFCLIAVSSAQAQWYWPFGGRDTWATAPRAVQDAEAISHMQSAQAAQQRGSTRSALRSYRTVYRRFPASRYAPEALYQTGVLRMEQRRWRHAFEAFQRLIRFYPNFPQFNQVISHQFDIATALAEGDGVRVLGVFPSRALGRSVSVYEQLIRNAPYSDYAPLALMNVALIHRYRNDQIQAIDALDRLINLYPSSLLAADAYLNLADTFASLVDGPLYDQGATREAISYYEDFLVLHSDSPLVADGEEGLAEMREIHARSKYVLGHYYYRYRSHYRAARVFLNESITIAPESNAAQDARELLDHIEEVIAALPEPEELEPRIGFWERLMFWRDRDPDAREVEAFEAARRATEAEEEEAQRDLDAIEAERY